MSKSTWLISPCPPFFSLLFSLPLVSLTSESHQWILITLYSACSTRFVQDLRGTKLTFYMCVLVCVLMMYFFFVNQVFDLLMSELYACGTVDKLLLSILNVSKFYVLSITNSTHFCCSRSYAEINLCRIFYFFFPFEFASG